jgi:uncharacterized BrkB/YihY/UPF0761 family membrane protein
MVFIRELLTLKTKNMWEKINKLSVKVVVAVIIVLASFGLLYFLLFKQVPEHNKQLLDVMVGATVGSSMTAVLGWLFTQSKTG